MKSALEVFHSQSPSLRAVRKAATRGNKLQADPEVLEFWQALEAHGAAGLLGEYLLLAQRSHDRLQKVHDRKYPDPDYERLLRSRNNWNIGRLMDFCLQEQSRLDISMKRFKYGMRVTLRKEAVIRFRHVYDYWTGDDANLQPICMYCDRLVSDERTADRLGKICPWPTAI